MNLDLLPPNKQLALIVGRLYKNGLTTVSGGNVSVLDAEGEIWITPAGLDKGALTEGDMRRASDTAGGVRPSSELPFHAAIYNARPDIRAVIHAHPEALMAYSLTRMTPDACLLASVSRVLGRVGIASYALPGSAELSENIASGFKSGADVLIMENHGLVVGAKTLALAYTRLEAFNLSAQIEINARAIGAIKPAASVCAIKPAQAACFSQGGQNESERFAREAVCETVRRMASRGLYRGGLGALSVRLKNGAFLITPDDCDLFYVKPQDIVKVENGLVEGGAPAPFCALLHKKIYDGRSFINALIEAVPPYIMAYGVTDGEFTTRVIPESYIVCRDVKKAPCALYYADTDALSQIFTRKTPVVICENDRVIAAGGDLPNAYDRLEVAEATAKSLILSRNLGQITEISNAQIGEINKAFNLPV